MTTKLINIITLYVASCINIQNAIFKLNGYLYNFSDITPKHILNLFDKLVKRKTNDAGIIIMLAYNHNCVLD